MNRIAINHLFVQSHYQINSAINWISLNITHKLPSFPIVTAAQLNNFSEEKKSQKGRSGRKFDIFTWQMSCNDSSIFWHWHWNAIWYIFVTLYTHHHIFIDCLRLLANSFPFIRQKIIIDLSSFGCTVRWN